MPGYGKRRDKRESQGEQSLQPACLSTRPLLIAYHGPSMNPTLVEPELLDVVPYDERPVRVGDVIFFTLPDGRAVVHRVVQSTPAGISTRGDNNPHLDPWLLQPVAISGRIVAAQDAGKRRVIHGGRVGMAWHRLLRRWRSINRVTSRLLHRPYRALAANGIVAKHLPAPWRPRVAVFGARRLLLWGRRVIGHYDAQRGQWIIRRPYRLLVDATEL